MHENYCVICVVRKIISKLCLIVTKRVEKTAVMLDNYCRIDVTTERRSQYICANAELVNVALDFT